MAGEPNGLVKVGRSNAHGYVEEHLDYEQMWEQDGDFVFKAYDQNGGIVYVKMNKTTVLEGVFGDLTLPAEES